MKRSQKDDVFHTERFKSWHHFVSCLKTILNEKNPDPVFSPGSWEDQGACWQNPNLFKILLLSLFHSHFWTTFHARGNLVLVFHVISLEVSLSLWLTVPFNETSGRYCDRFHGRVNELNPYQCGRKSNEKTLGKVSVPLLSVFSLLMDRIPVPDV